MKLLSIGWESYQELAAIRCFSCDMLVSRVAIVVLLAFIYFGLQSYSGISRTCAGSAVCTRRPGGKSFPGHHT
ncbi:uncharacterized protein BO88DRAFT_408717 [Aspergillus vadensis CBS 113365]|uniref:Uncharacterized protein n=1 Tax=Aspergillus vadensis (strain CBS 113365 / IMI 142717 / IBT 24658) TaxID=1448311 RepID=A0A319B1K3_ASPVC|nr:hypothetical protein BO88DRAFT_408717 [Aspergillus vadensis CBS 113365]PYH64050.1 hypothetical protein BO88DRAFT_408717 [Aspergillus vadensis CBS 113365]